MKLVLHNDGARPVRYTLAANDYLGGTRAVTVDGGTTHTVLWPTQQGYYDVVLTVDTDSAWTQRYAGRIATTGQC